MNMMNDTVARIVDLMFENAEMTEEVAALRDEVMNNCQERYSDLTSSGVPEDDAVAAVVESLKGMEDVIAQHNKKTRRAERRAAEETVHEEAEGEDSGEREMIFAAQELHRIDLMLVNEDVMLEASDDADYHVLWNADENPLVQAEVHGGVLKIERRPGAAPKMRKDGYIEIHHHDDKTDFVRTEDGNITIDMKGIDGMIRSIGQSLKNAFSKVSISFGDSGVTIQIPENAMPHVKLLTTSGDIDVQDVALADLSITSTSGDINIDLNENQYLKLVEVRATSGDIEATAFTHEMTIASTSGDVEVEGYHHNLTVNTISGDIDVRADVKNMTFKTASGDVELEFESEEIRDVQGSTISGDIDVDLPDGIGTMAIQTQTRSGDVTTRCHTNGHGPTVTGSVTSMSGDITIS